jgi:glycerophosphoryl diester phosphodiesterase
MFFDCLPEKNLLCAHRGARSIAPENTLLALKKARECGAHCWETDVRMSKEGELIIFHDATLERTTNIVSLKDLRNRHPWKLDQFTLSELRELDAGSWFLDDDPFGTVASGEVLDSEHGTIQGQSMPMLREILEFTKAYRFPVNLELKDLKTPPGDVTVVDKVMDMLRETETMDLVLLSSFRHEYLYRARTLSQRVSIAVLAEERHPPDLIQYLKSFSAVAYHPEEALCDAELIVNLHHAGLRVNSWTINNMERAKEIFRLGAGVITDWPQRLV